MRTWLAFLALLPIAAPGPCQDLPADQAAFDQALADFRWQDAARQLDALIVSRNPADGRPKADSLIAARSGRFFYASFQPDAAIAAFRRVEVAKLPAGE